MGRSYTPSMTRVGTKGQVVIPKPLRDALGLRPGDEVEFHLEGRGVRIEPAPSLEGWRGSLAGMGLLEELEGEHRAELEKELRDR